MSDTGKHSPNTLSTNTDCLMSSDVTSASTCTNKISDTKQVEAHVYSPKDLFQ